MGRLRTITRRTFLIGSVAISGGVAFGSFVSKRTPDNPLERDLAEGEATFNAWVKISDQRVTLVTPHVDMGQGAHSMQAALIAEELDIEFGQFDIDQGTPSPAYWNTAFSEEAVPFLSTDISFPAETMRRIAGSAIKLIGVQATGGSTSTPDSYEKLRMAGAVARETLKAAASTKTGVAIGDLKTENGAVILPDGTAIAYTDLAGDAARMAPVGDVELRDPSTWRMVGKDMMRLDILPKSTGTLTYGIDLEVDGMVHASVRMNPRKGAGVLSYDASTANAMAGVSQVLPVTNGVAAVASNTWYAIQAVNAVQVEWADAPYPHEQADHWAAVAASFTPEHLDKEWRHDGDVPAALEAGDVLSSEYRAPYVAHQPLEPLSAIVLVTDARVDVWIAHQMPRFAQARVAAITGHDTDDVYLHNQYMGGSFGHRLEFENLDRATEIALALKGTPVKMTFSREEDFTQDFPRQIGMSRASGTVKNGQIESYDLHIATPSSGRSQSGRLGGEAPGADSQIPAGAWNMPYDLPNLRVTAYAVPELAPISSWRSVGASTGGFFGEGFMDELCHAVGADPMEERLRLVNDPVARKVLEAAAEMSNWGSEMAQGQGRGVAFVSSFGTPVAEVVEVTNTSSGIRIDRVYVVADVGRVIDPVNFENLVQGGVIWGLGHAINSEITYSDGMAEQTNYHAAEGMRLYQTPEIIVRGLENGNKIKGIGEPPIPPAGPALANAIFAATGQRLREMPFYNHIDFV